jgi:hypothetical protein
MAFNSSRGAAKSPCRRNKRETQPQSSAANACPRANQEGPMKPLAVAISILIGFLPVCAALFPGF